MIWNLVSGFMQPAIVLYLVLDISDARKTNKYNETPTIFIELILF